MRASLPGPCRPSRAASAISRCRTRLAPGCACRSFSPATTWTRWPPSAAWSGRCSSAPTGPSRPRARWRGRARCWPGPVSCSTARGPRRRARPLWCSCCSATSACPGAASPTWGALRMRGWPMPWGFRRTCSAAIFPGPPRARRRSRRGSRPTPSRPARVHCGPVPWCRPCVSGGARRRPSTTTTATIGCPRHRLAVRRSARRCAQACCRGVSCGAPIWWGARLRALRPTTWGA